MKVITKAVPFLTLLGMSMTALGDVPAETIPKEQGPFSLKASVVIVAANDSFSTSRTGGGTVEAGGNVLAGVSIAGEYHLNKLMSFELGAAFTGPLVANEELTGNDITLDEGPGFIPVWLGANFHLLTTEKFDVYAGPRVGYAIYSDFDLGAEGEFETEDTFTWGGAIGADYHFGGGPFALHTEVAYLVADMDVNEKGTSGSTTSIEFNPLIVQLGASYRF